MENNGLKIIGGLTHLKQSFPGGTDCKESACNAGDPGSVPGLGRFPGKEWQPSPVFLPGKSHDKRSLAGYTVHSITRVGHDLVTTY